MTDTESARWSLTVGAEDSWRPPFGLDRIGTHPVVRVVLSGPDRPADDVLVVAFRNGTELERYPLALEPAHGFYAEAGPRFAASASLGVIPDAVELHLGARRVLREPVNRPDVEVAARARSAVEVHPVDLGTVLVPHDVALLAEGGRAVVDVAAISRIDRPEARVRVRFDNGDPVEVPLPLAADVRATTRLDLAPVSDGGDRGILRVELVAGGETLWATEITTMIARPLDPVPGFGAIRTRLRYDSPIPVRDAETGERSSLDYDTAWPAELDDVVVFLPNGSRYVFWRGSNYIPFWAGPGNTGFCYEWAETIPPGADGSIEPLADRELRYSRVRIIDSTPARVHVQWRYQPTREDYEVWGESVTEDYYFYPDGYGTRVVTVASDPGRTFELTEFLFFTASAAYPLEVLRPRIDLLYLDGERRVLDWTPGAITPAIVFAGDEPTALKPIAVDRGEGTSGVAFRIYERSDEAVSSLYFSPDDRPASLFAYPPRTEDGRPIAPGFWGSHGPLSRDSAWERDLIQVTPAHTSVVTWGISAPNDPQPRPSTVSRARGVDALGRPRVQEIRRWSWLIGQTDDTDDEVVRRAISFEHPPAVELEGAGLDLPSYAGERRAIRLIAESSRVRVRLSPTNSSVNPVLEIADAPAEIRRVSLDGEPLDPSRFRWSAGVLWLDIAFGPEGVELVIEFD